ncbi:RHS repeat-associated core domain-containing protein [Pseudomonas sp. MYb118]|uniref:RHS repeat-associated core domain-containing protein n=1 Tax=Pseudomonas sp. MYb118 TaxID=1848720 RepID=UPI0034CEFD36
MNAHRDTPTLAIVDPRSLAVRSVGYCRLPDEADIESRVTRQIFDGVGRAVASWDPRLFGLSTKANQTTVYGLGGQPVLTESVDAGWQLKLMNHAGSLHSVWDGRGNQTRFEYDDQQRPLAVIEQMQVVDRFSYGDGTASRNKCGQLIRHDDPAGSGVIDEYGLLGTALVESRRFLKELETPDWPVDLEEREQWLEEQSYVTRHAFLPTGDVEHQTDAMGNVQSFVFDVAGSRRESWLLLAGKQPQCLISDVRYNALGQVESETAGNGVRTQFFYGDDDGRLLRSIASVAGENPLQDLNYTYDPAGNITELEDKAQSVTWFNNQRVEPINRYRYDSLYQLIEASGWEVVTPSHGPALPALLPIPLDPNQRRNYTQRFDYDKAGNLITRHHSNAPSLSMFTSAHSNRSLPQCEDGSLPGESDIDAGFDASGNLLELQRGQIMTWDIRNQLSRVTLVSRNDDPGDDERYAYDRPGHRVRKVSVSHNSRRALHEEVRYLPNLEIRRQADGEEHHVISVEAGRSSVRALHWPQGARADQLRYSLSDHLGSSTLELDEKAGVLTQEHYYAFGGTACWAGKSALVAKYKINRYSGKERDGTGLYYYGHRYYAPWLLRWLSADPLGMVDGPNVYLAFKNNPVKFVDPEGTVLLNFSKILAGTDAIETTKVVVNYEIPEMRPGPQFNFYLAQSMPGNSFTGLINVSKTDDELSGVVDIYPLEPDWRVNERDLLSNWRTKYSGKTHNDGSPIEHARASANYLTSHAQALKIFDRDLKVTAGFTFRDVRGLPLTPEGYRKMPAISGNSATANAEKTFKVPHNFESVGSNIEDFNKAFKMSNAYVSGVAQFGSIPLEVQRYLLTMFAEASKELKQETPSLVELFEAELLRPELQLPLGKTGAAAKTSQF